MNDQYILNIDKTIVQIMGYLERVDGEVGIEIEIEGENLVQKLAKYWRVERDGSLRGNEAAEYVLVAPLKRADYKKALDYLAASMKKRGAKIDNSGRAGVHVHLNFQDVAARNVANMVCLYMMYEDALTNFCGDGRTGNLFCLGTRYAENVIDVFKKFIQQGHKQTLHTDELRYASINLKALTIYGSIEFRSMRSTLDVDVLDTWVKILLSLKDAALKFKNPVDILNKYSQIGHDRITQQIFGDNTRMLTNNYIDPEMVREAMWRIQPIAFSRDWGKAPKEANGCVQYVRQDGVFLEKDNKELFREEDEVIPRPRGVFDPEDVHINMPGDRVNKAARHIMREQQRHQARIQEMERQAQVQRNRAERREHLQPQAGLDEWAAAPAIDLEELLAAAGPEVAAPEAVRVNMPGDADWIPEVRQVDDDFNGDDDDD